MSAFLGPIHYWMFNKINLQEQLNETLLVKAEEVQNGEVQNSEAQNSETQSGEALAEAAVKIEKIKTDIDSHVGQVAQGDLADIIDGSNIHGWLQHQVNIVESRFAYIVTALLSEGGMDIVALAEIAADFGRSHKLDGHAPSPFAFSAGAANAAAESEDSNGKKIGKINLTAKEAHADLENLLLDGMPCDRVNMTTEESDQIVEWVRQVNLHQEFWAEAEGNPENYDILRNAMISGMLEGSGLNLTQDGDMFRISGAEN